MLRKILILVTGFSDKLKFEGGIISLIDTTFPEHGLTKLLDILGNLGVGFLKKAIIQMVINVRTIPKEK